MPLIHATLIENVFSQAQKQEMIEKLTDAMVSIEGEKLRSFTWVVIEEVKDGNLGIWREAAIERRRSSAIRQEEAEHVSPNEQGGIP